MYGGRGFCGFVLMLIGKMSILTIFLQLQDNIKLIERFEGCYYTRLESYYIIFNFETDWSRIRPLPSTTLRIPEPLELACAKSCTPEAIAMWFSDFGEFLDVQDLKYENNQDGVSDNYKHFR